MPKVIAINLKGRKLQVLHLNISNNNIIIKNFLNVDSSNLFQGNLQKEISSKVKKEKDSMVICSLDDVSITDLKLPVLPQAQVEGAIKYQIEDALAIENVDKRMIIPIELYRVNGQVTYLCLLPQKSVIGEVIKTISDCGFEPHIVGSSSVGLVNFLFWIGFIEKHPNLICVFKDGLSIELVVIRESKLFSLRKINAPTVEANNIDFDYVMCEIIRYLNYIGILVDEFTYELLVLPKMDPEAGSKHRFADLLSRKLGLNVVEMDIFKDNKVSIMINNNDMNVASAKIDENEIYKLLPILGVALQSVDVKYPVDFRREEYSLVRHWDIIKNALKFFLLSVAVLLFSLSAVLYRELKIEKMLYNEIYGSVAKIVKQALPGQSSFDVNTIGSKIKSTLEQEEFDYGQGSYYPLKEDAADMANKIYKAVTDVNGVGIKDLHINLATENITIQAETPSESAADNFLVYLKEKLKLDARITGALKSTKEGNVSFMVSINLKKSEGKKSGREEEKEE